MVDSRSGTWYAEKDYANYPKENWCDMDRIANVVINKIKKDDYRVETSIENICYMILDGIESSAEMEERELPMILDEDIINEEIEMHGTLRDFDYEC